MSTSDTYLAIFLGDKSGPRMAAWNALSEAERRTRTQDGIAAWTAWAAGHRAAIVGMGGPPGMTKRVTSQGIADVSNQLGAYAIVRADSYQSPETLTYAVMTGRRAGHLSPHVLIEMTGSVAGHDADDVKSQAFGRLVSHEAAAKLFERHPHFTRFPGDCVEVMPILPTPDA